MIYDEESQRRLCGRLVQWYDSCFGYKRSRVQFPDRPYFCPSHLSISILSKLPKSYPSYASSLRVLQNLQFQITNRMNTINMDSPQTNQIIRLRIQLAKTKGKLAKYEQFVSKMEQFDRQINTLIEYFNSRQNVIYDLCGQVGVEMQPQRLVWKENNSKDRWETNDHLLNMIYKHEQIGKCLEKQQLVLKNISKAVASFTDKDKIHIDQYKELEKEHKECSSKINGFNKQLQKMKNLEKELKLKQLKIIELEKIREEHEMHAGELAVRIDHQNVRIRQLQGDIEEKQREISKVQEREAEDQMITFQKEKALERCQNLIESLTVGEEDFLSHYFKSNGLPLQSQKPYKNKYSMVFE